MAMWDNLNLTTSPGVEPSVVEYHNKSLLRNVKPKLVHQRDMQLVPLPKHNGRRVQFRRYIPFAACTEPLAEGITPPGQELQMAEQFATILPYGRHVELTDEMNWALLDDTHRIANEALSDQASLTLDTLARDAYHSGLNVRYAGGKTKRSELTAADKLGYDDIRKAVRDLKKRMARKFSDGFYHAFVDSDTVFDLTDKTNNPLWVDVATYQDKRKIETGELGCVAGVKFFETQNGKMFEKAQYLFETTASLTVSANSLNEKEKTIKTTARLTDAQCRKLTNKLVDLTHASNGTEQAYIESVETDGTIHLRWIPTMTIGSGVTIVPTGAGASDYGVHSTVIYGQDFVGGVSLDGNGQNIQAIIKPIGSSGADDPLNQRGTLAWKVKGVCYCVLQDAFGVRIEHGASA